MSKKVKVNSFHNLTRCVHRTSRDKDKIGFQKMKMKLQIAAGVLIFVLFELSLVQFSTCSPVPDISERQKSVYHNIAEKKEKCPQGLHKCTCVERNNRGRKLDITCNGVDTHELKVSLFKFATRNTLRGYLKSIIIFMIINNTNHYHFSMILIF